MLTSFKRIGGALLGLTLGICCSVPALADDTEIYVNSTTPSPEVRPNILFIVDTSGSMKEPDSIEPRDLYKSDTTYAVISAVNGARRLTASPLRPEASGTGRRRGPRRRPSVVPRACGGAAPRRP